MNRLRIFLLTILAVVVLPAHGRERPPPGTAAIASAHPLATAAGHEILEKGGNAFDAAVAVSAALGVVEPYSGGLGGGGFWLLHRAEDGKEVMLDLREVAPGAATRDMYLDDRGNPIRRASLDGPLAAGIPGMAAGLEHLAENYGRLPLAQSLQPAIRLAREGFPTFRRLREALSSKQKILSRWPAGTAVFLPGDRIPELGELIVQEDLAKTLERIAAEGRDGFYKGPLARAMVEAVRADGGIWTEEDLAGYQVVEREPIVFEYRGARIVAASLPSSGGVALANMLQILSGYPLDAFDRATRVHVTAEAMRRAFRDRAEYLGDPDFVPVPVTRLTHPYYAAGQRASIRLDRATPSSALPGYIPADEGENTTHFSILDADGNRVAGTQSINAWFGSCYMIPGTGMLLNNEMDDFAIKPGVENQFQLVGAQANSIAPGKRMLSSMTPTFAESDRGLVIIGTPGGSRIISMVLLGLLDWVDGADAETIVSRPRYHHQYLPDEVFYEEGAFSAEEVRQLEAMGHTMRKSNRLYGNMQVVTWDYQSDKVDAASDPRWEGGAQVWVY
ncbi:MAG: gamma-glutamyltransferase [Gammaproteobacteria bacterium]|jgi:gamma-glutamyltranspeptidase/glutathione hydrolase